MVALPDSAMDARHTLTLVMGIGLGPLFVAGSLLSWGRRAWFTAAALKAFKTTDPEKVKPQDIFGFYDPRDVEIAARSCRVWADRYQLDKAAVTRAQELIKAGVARFPGSAYVNLVYANFLLVGGHWHGVGHRWRGAPAQAGSWRVTGRCHCVSECVLRGVAGCGSSAPT